MGIPAIRTDALSKRYGDKAALLDLTLHVDPGEIVGYLGPNGAGKTTTIRLLLGLLRATSGRAEIFGLDADAQATQAHRRLAYVPGEAALWPALSGLQTLHLLGKLHGITDFRYRDELIERFDLDPSKKVRTYSKGNKQKVLLIGALMGRPDLLILDEPTSGLDPLMEAEFRQCLIEARSGGQAVFLSSHALGQVEAVCDRVAILRAGRLVEFGELSELRHLKALQVRATFEGLAPDVSGVPGVSDVAITDHVLTCRVQGPMAPLMSAIMRGNLLSLTSTEPSVEELFLSYYGDAP